MRLGSQAAMALAASLFACSLLFESEDLQGGGTGGAGGAGGNPPDAAGGAGTSGTGWGDASADADASQTGCPPGAADCGGAEDGCETVLATDPGHCGSCGRSCFGSSCASGQCVPQKLISFPMQASGSEFPTMVTLHAGSLYAAHLAGKGGVWRVDEASAVTWKPALHVLELPGTVDVAPFDGGLVASAFYGPIHAKGQGSFNLVDAAGWGLDISGGKLAATTQQDLLIYELSEIAAALAIPDASAPDSSSTPVTGPGLLDVTIAGNHYCYTRASGSVGCTSWAGELGVTPTPYAIANDGTYVYWTETGSSGEEYGVQRALIAPLGAANPPPAKRVLSGGYRAYGLAVLDGKLFVALAGGSGDGIVEVDVSGANRRDLAKTPAPFGVAVDATFVYYSSWDGVFRVRR